ncbi:sugar transporter [Flagellimonas olearia]|uniref:Sugar transporter n=1 Tax=Flagellimonas olearia TaxID=552546 RepID=A0A6I1E9T5_9FLAO|nr:sugar transporter [Allomuricauda olearia]KAB7530494.1 sugar transporter [Allomuricauda olearia]
MSRIKKSLKNAQVSVLYYSLTIILGFYSRKVFLDFLGDDFIGLTTLFTKVLSILNIAELGIGTAVSYALYKPLLHSERKTIKDLVVYLAHFYKKIGTIILCLGIGISLFFPFFFKDLPFSFILIYYAYLSTLFAAVSNYFFNYHTILFQADQRDYVITRFFQGVGLIKTIVQIVLLYIFQNYYVWVTIEVVFTITLIIGLRSQAKKTYDWLFTDSMLKLKPKKFPDVLGKIKQIVIHRLAWFILIGTDQILIYSIINLKSVAYYGNYMLIFNYTSTFSNKLLDGMQASIGNLLAENNKQNINSVFWEIMSLRHFIGGFLFIALYFLTNDFVTLWIGEKYLFEQSILFFLILNIYIGQVKKPVDQFVIGYGAYNDTWASITQAVLNLGISIWLGLKWGILGIVLGYTISLTLISLVWKPFFLFKYHLKFSLLKYWVEFFKLSASIPISYLVINKIMHKINFMHVGSYQEWFLKSFIITAIAILTMSAIMYPLSKGFRSLLDRLFNLIKRKFL